MLGVDKHKWNSYEKSALGIARMYKNQQIIDLLSLTEPNLKIHLDSLVIPFFDLTVLHPEERNEIL
jgi:hypothetical protein